MPGAFLHVIGGPAGARVGMPAGAEHVQADGQAVALGRRIDRPVAAIAERLGRAGQHEHLREGRVVGAALDLGDGRRGVLVRHDDGRP